MSSRSGGKDRCARYMTGAAPMPSLWVDSCYERCGWRPVVRPACTTVPTAAKQGRIIYSPLSIKEDPMSQFKNALHNEYQLLQMLHDELALKAHLFKADMKSNWEALEVEWLDFKEHLGRAQVAAGDAGRDIDAASKPLADALKAGFTGIKNAFKH
jgi:hypothetical protein